MPKFQYIGEPFSRENPGTICDFMEYDAVEMRAKSTNDWQELPNDYVAPKVHIIADSTGVLAAEWFTNILKFRH